MANLKQAVKAVKLQTIVTAVMLAVIGILFIVFPDTSLKVLCYIAGAIMIFLGACRLVFYFIELSSDKHSTSLVSGIMLLVVGIVFVIYPDVIVGIFTIIFALVMIMDGIEKLQTAINSALAKQKNWWIDLIIACVVLVLGIIVLCCRASSWIMIFAGVSLIVEGVLDFVGAMLLSSKDLEDDKKDNHEVIDV